ncbi:unnamed protein product [Schistocephalus solidus]|uniref:Uncharacterized protein n=1 Tax=Schistocephalus solidus TaxID=70667 RepID=A0A183SZC4_SCHSO|nr:unnamed protein product [Schistocephalus solidus]
MQDAWMIRKAEEIQGYVDRNEMKNLFKAIKAIYGPCTKGTAPLLSSAGTTFLTDQSLILKRWAEHFRSVLNCSSASATPASDPTTTTITPTTDEHFIDAPPRTMTDTILPPPPPALITYEEHHLPHSHHLSSHLRLHANYLSPAITNTTTALSTSDGDSVLTCPHCDRTFTSCIGLVGNCESIAQRLAN